MFVMAVATGLRQDLHMKRFLPVLLLIMLGLALYPFVGNDGGSEKVTGLPWQIELQPDGFARTFGIVPGKSTLAQAAAALGADHELALVAKDGTLSLEMYVSHYRAGLLSGKMVLVAAAETAWLAQLQQHVVKTGYMGDGKAKKLLLDAAGRQLAMRRIVESVTFIPAVNLDDEIIRNRFGEPAQVLEQAGGVRHYLYPDKGLDIALGETAKEVLQYVAPPAFERLRAPLAGRRSSGESAEAATPEN